MSSAALSKKDLKPAFTISGPDFITVLPETEIQSVQSIQLSRKTNSNKHFKYIMLIIISHKYLSKIMQIIIIRRIKLNGFRL